MAGAENSVSRRAAILQRLRETGRVSASQLAEDFGVTPETIRRDLVILERKGQVHRTFGGAIVNDHLPYDPGLRVRSQLMLAEKQRIAKAALEYVPAEASIAIDGGSTTEAFAKIIPTELNLTIVTHSLPIASALVGAGHRAVVMPGGVVRAESMCVVGQWQKATFNELRVDIAFLGTNGASSSFGFSTSNEFEAEAKSALLKSARWAVVLSDHTKLGLDSIYRYASVGDVLTLITDSGADQELLEDFRSKGLEVVVA